jgi:hypothetical protein
MATKPGLSDAERIRAYHAKLAERPRRIVITGATAYWLEDASGAVIGAEAPSSDVPLVQVLALVADGFDAENLRLVCRGGDFERYVISDGGVMLIGAAEAAAGIPARDRRAEWERLGRP